MPNVKIFLDETVWRERGDELRANLAPLRSYFVINLEFQSLRANLPLSR
jgi:hypothetical protein